MADERSVFDVSWRTIAKILVAIAVVWAWLQLWQFVMVIIIAMVMAVAFNPLVERLEQRGVPRWVGALGSVLLLTAAIVGMIAASWASITEQSQLIFQNLQSFYQQVRVSMPGVDRVLPSGQQGSTGIGQYALSLGRSALNAVAMVVFALVLTVYLLVEWKPTLEWLVAFVPAQHRQKARRTISESRATVFHYVVGNATTSVITAIATFIALVALKVPAALVLAIIAGVFDFIPIVGFLLSLGITALLAATVSTTTLLWVVAFYVAFNAVENYFIIPKVYGRELELSNLAVLIAVSVGGLLGGVMGALLALPIAAIYPTIERIWLRQRLSDDTVEIHQRLSA
jgi:predicted PurR-regulated permease PerM